MTEKLFINFTEVYEFYSFCAMTEKHNYQEIYKNFIDWICIHNRIFGEQYYSKKELAKKLKDVWEEATSRMRADAQCYYPKSIELSDNFFMTIIFDMVTQKSIDNSFIKKPPITKGLFVKISIEDKDYSRGLETRDYIMSIVKQSEINDELCKNLQ